MITCIILRLRVFMYFLRYLPAYRGERWMTWTAIDVAWFLARSAVERRNGQTYYYNTRAHSPFMRL